MRAIRQFRQYIINLSLAIVTKVILETLIELIGKIHIIINDEFQIVTDTARNIDTVLIRQFCIEIGCGIHRTAIYKRLTIQIAID